MAARGSVIRPVPAPHSTTRSSGSIAACATSSRASELLRRRCWPLGRDPPDRERDFCAPRTLTVKIPIPCFLVSGGRQYTSMSLRGRSDTDVVK